jgi:hypothetical protein
MITRDTAPLASAEESDIRVRAARLWLGDGYVTREKIAKLRRLLISSRGPQYADEMIAEMRTQWSTRPTWMTAGADPPA